MPHPAGRQVARQSADARVGGGEARPGQGFDQIVNLLPFGEGEQENRQRADIHGEGTQTQQVGGNAGQLAADHPDILATRRERLVNPHQFFHRQRVGHVVGQRGQIIQPVGVRNELGVGHVLRDLFISPMQIADLRRGFGDDFPVQFQHHAQDAVSGGMGRPHIEAHFLPVHVPRVGGGGVRLRGEDRRIGILDFLGRHN